MKRKHKKVLYRIIAATIFLIAAAALPVPQEVKIVLYMISYITIGYDILRKAFLGIIHGQVFDENFLMALATVGAILLGDYPEGTFVMLFYQIGELFQALAVDRSRKNISDLMDIAPEYANLEIEEGEIEEVDPDDVELGSIIVIKPGERIPLDGVIVEGSSVVNTSALTGESVPSDVIEGDEVISGCVNMTGVLRVKTTKEYGDSTVVRILELIENSSMKKARTENFITRFAKYYTPAVCIGAAVLAVVPPLISMAAMHGSPEWSVWITRALTFLVISCPCALVISVPLSFFGGIGGASRNGILIKGANYLELLAKVKYAVFDKTGTLTKGEFEIAEIKSVGISENELLRYCAYAEIYSDHPVSCCIKNAYKDNLEAKLVSNTEEISGHGVETDLEGHRISAGNAKLMNLRGIEFEVRSDLPGTVVYVAVDGEYRGYIRVADTVKEDAAEAMAELKKQGVKQITMLTGDTKNSALAVADQLGIDAVKYELLPENKVIEVEALLNKKSSGEQLMFAGDGINDAPVLVRADIGIAMGAMGSDAAIEAADIVLMDDDPAKIALAMKISGKTIRIVYENIVFALTVKGICLVLGALGLAGMWAAVFADVGVMVIAVLNAMRTLRVTI